MNRFASLRLRQDDDLVPVRLSSTFDQGQLLSGITSATRDLERSRPPGAARSEMGGLICKLLPFMQL